MKTHEIIKRALSKLGGSGSGNYGHAGRPGKRGGSATKKGGGGVIPDGWESGSNDTYHKRDGTCRVRVFRSGDTWVMEPSKEGFKFDLTRKGLDQATAFERGEGFLKEHGGSRTFKVPYTNKSGREATKTVVARTAYQALNEVARWEPKYWRESATRRI